jgi:plastocyanin
VENPVNRLVPLALLPLLLSACGASGSSGGTGAGGSSDTVTTTGEASAQTATVGMNDKLAFAPSTVSAKVGAVTLAVKNLGQVPHNLHFDDEALGKTGTVSGGESEDLRVTFDKAGTFTFVCTFHSGMDGKVVVS